MGQIVNERRGIVQTSEYCTHRHTLNMELEIEQERREIQGIRRKHTHTYTQVYTESKWIWMNWDEMGDCNIKKNVKSKLCRNVVFVVCRFLFAFFGMLHAYVFVLIHSRGLMKLKRQNETSWHFWFSRRSWMFFYHKHEHTYTQRLMDDNVIQYFYTCLCLWLHLIMWKTTEQQKQKNQRQNDEERKVSGSIQGERE